MSFAECSSLSPSSITNPPHGSCHLMVLTLNQNPAPHRPGFHSIVLSGLLTVELEIWSQGLNHTHLAIPGVCE